jgi:hypothetical protein
MYIILRAKKWLALEGKEGGKARRGVGVVTSRSVALLPNAHAPPARACSVWGWMIDDRVRATNCPGTSCFRDLRWEF